MPEPTARERLLVTLRGNNMRDLMSGDRAAEIAERAIRAALAEREEPTP
jgi:hypothetical protein